MTLPPAFIKTERAHNPGTQTWDAVYYAVNPDYDMFQCLARYCGSARADLKTQNCLQYMVTTNYDRPRVWRVNPHVHCQTSPITGRQDCPEGVAREVPFASAEDGGEGSPHSAPLFSDAGFASCDAKIDLLVHNMEWFDDQNVVATVLRGSVGDLYLDGFLQERPRTVGAGSSDGRLTAYTETVFYFIDTETQRVREGVPWPRPTAAHLSGGTASVGALCPELQVRVLALCVFLQSGRTDRPVSELWQVMPPLGSFVGHAFAALFEFVGVVANDYVVNLYPILQSMASPDGARCRDRTYMHTPHTMCGERAFSLRAAFDSAHASNVYAFSTLGYIGEAVVAAVGRSASVVEEVLAGIRMFGEVSSSACLPRVASAHCPQRAGLSWQGPC